MRTDDVNNGSPSESRPDLDPAVKDIVVENIVAAYIDRLNAGEQLDIETIVREYPEVGSDVLENLQSYLDMGSTREGEQPLGTLGDYTLRRQIGRGGMGVVYEAWENSMDRRVALKVLPAGIAADTRASARFLREAQTAGKLSHPNVVPVYFTGVKEQTPFYAMEFVDGETLAQILVRIKNAERDAETPFGRKDDVRYFHNLTEAFADVADGLQHAHSRGVIHRDIKPSNLILDSEGKLRILDFGLARLEGQESLTLSGDLMGTVLYMSPEQARAKRISLDHRTDVYSLGATMYEALTGAPPFRGKDHHDTLSQIVVRDPRPPRQLNPRVPVDLETIGLKCLRKDAGDRYGTAEALAQDLRRFVRGDPVEARPEARWGRLRRRLRSRRRQIFVTGLVLILLAAVGAFWLRARRAERERQLAAYRPAVESVLERLSRGRFSLDAASGLWTPVIDFRDLAFVPVSPQDFQRFSSPEGSQAFEEAVEQLARIGATLPDERDAHYHLARAYLTLGRREEARRKARAVLDLDSDFVPARVLLLELSHGLGREDLARRKDLKKLADRWASQAGRESWQAEWLEAYHALNRGRWAQAVVAYGRLLLRRRAGADGEPYTGCFAEALLRRGVALLRTRRPLEALDAFTRAEVLLPGIEPALLRGTAYHGAGMEEEADRCFGRLYEVAPPGDKDLTALWIVAVYSSLRDCQKALRWTREHLSATPLRPRIEAFLSYRLGLNEEAIARAREAIARDGGDVIAHQVLTLALLKRFWARQGSDRAADLALLLKTARRAAALDKGRLSAFLLKAAECEQKYNALRLERRTIMKETKTGRPLREALRAGVLGALLMVPAGAGRAGEPYEGYVDDVVAVPEVNSPAAEMTPCISHDGLTLIFESRRAGGAGGFDLYMAQRDAPDGPFTQVRRLSEINSSFDDGTGCISADGLELFFISDRPGGAGNYDLYVATREDPDGLFASPPSSLEALNNADAQGYPWISQDGTELYFNAGTNSGLWVARRQGPGAPFTTEPELVFNTNEYGEIAPRLSADGLTLFFSDWAPGPRPGGMGQLDIWALRRAAPGDPFLGEPVNLGAPINTPLCEGALSVSSDWPAEGSRIYFSRSATCDFDSSDIYEATWHTPPDTETRFLRGDCNDDGEVNISDATCILNWLFAGEADPGCVAATNTNGDDAANITDATYLLNHLFAGGPVPVAPYPDCGTGELPVELSCENTPPACQSVGQ